MARGFASARARLHQLGVVPARQFERGLQQRVLGAVRSPGFGTAPPARPTATHAATGIRRADRAPCRARSGQACRVCSRMASSSASVSDGAPSCSSFSRGRSDSGQSRSGVVDMNASGRHSCWGVPAPCAARCKSTACAPDSAATASVSRRSPGLSNRACVTPRRRLDARTRARRRRGWRFRGSASTR